MRLPLLLLALAAGPSLQDVLDPASTEFPLTPYEWGDWPRLTVEQRQRAQGIDPEAWEEPPPDPPDPDAPPPEPEPERKGPPRHPEDRYPGFRFDERLKRKQEAFEALVGAAPPSTLAGLVKHLAWRDKAAERFQRTVDEATADFLDVKEQLDQATAREVENYRKRHGRAPDQVSVSASLLKDVYAKSKRLQCLVALQQSERTFEEWLVARIASLLRDLAPDDPAKPRDVLRDDLDDREPLVRARAADLLLQLGDPESVAAVEQAFPEEEDALVAAEITTLRGRGPDEGRFEFLRTRLDDARWPVRAAAVRALSAIPTKETVDLLVARLAKEDGRLRDDLAEALGRLTGQRHASEYEVWRVWWEKARADWKPPAQGIAAGADDKPGEGEKDVVYFYGIRTSSKRVVFCIDVSGSMEWPLDGQNGKQPPRIESAKRELLQALTMLPEEAKFNIVTYDATVAVWQKRMMDATIANKKRARQFVERLTVQGATNIHDALAASLEVALAEPRKGDQPEADTIFFLTDGVPTHGRIVEPGQILDAIRTLNHGAVVIHTIGVSKEQNAAFLLNLAKQNGGRYVAHK